jgi:hypothetical protein
VGGRCRWVCKTLKSKSFGEFSYRLTVLSIAKLSQLSRLVGWVAGGRWRAEKRMVSTVGVRIFGCALPTPKTCSWGLGGWFLVFIFVV